jgi:lactoylglutathione lyase
VQWPKETTITMRLGFSVPSLTQAFGQFRSLDATVVVEPTDTEFGHRAVVNDFEGHKVESYEKGA